MTFDVAHILIVEDNRDTSALLRDLLDTMLGRQDALPYFPQWTNSL